jgi:hypothetical protein
MKILQPLSQQAEWHNCDWYSAAATKPTSSDKNCFASPGPSCLLSDLISVFSYAIEASDHLELVVSGSEQLSLLNRVFSFTHWQIFVYRANTQSFMPNFCMSQCLITAQ